MPDPLQPWTDDFNAMEQAWRPVVEALGRRGIPARVEPAGCGTAQLVIPSEDPDDAVVVCTGDSADLEKEDFLALNCPPSEARFLGAAREARESGRTSEVAVVEVDGRDRRSRRPGRGDREALETRPARPLHRLGPRAPS